MHGLAILLVSVVFLCLPLSCKEAVSHDTGSVKGQKTIDQADMKKIYYGKSLLHDGDLVLRTGNDFISQTLRQFSTRDKTYSHCGIVRIENGKVYVYHAIGGEDNPDARLRRDNFEQFCNPRYNLGFGIFRYQLKRDAHLRLDSLVDQYYRERIRFDMKFDLGTDSSFYCAEFVYKAVERATGNNRFFSLSNIGNFKYVAIDDLFLTPHAAPVYHAVFR